MPLPIYNDPGVAASSPKKPRKPNTLRPSSQFPNWFNLKKIKPYDLYEPGSEPQATIGPKVYDTTKSKKLSELDKYLAGDASYQQTLRGNKRTLADFLSDLGRRRGEAGTQFNDTQASMTRDSEDQLNSLREEFASRGLIQSGLYGKEQGDFRQKFGEQMTALNKQQTGLLSDLMSQEKNYRRENSLANEAARQEAILRRAQKYKIGGK
jgi:hypothetical protein